MALLAVAILVVACGDDDDDDQTATAPSGGAPQDALAEMLKDMPQYVKDSPGGQYILNTRPNKRYKIGVALPNIQDPAYQLQVVWAQKYADLAGIDVQIVDARSYEESGRQTAQIEDLVQSGVQGIVLVPADAAAAGPPVKAARAKGIPVIEWITPDADKAYTSIVLNDLYQIGVEACLPLKALNPKAKVIMLTGPPSAQTAILRANGFRDCAKQSGMTILDELPGPSQRADAQNKMEDMLQKHGDQIDAVFTFGSFMSLGAADAIKAKNLNKKIFVTTTSPDSETVKRLITGEISSVVDQHLAIGIMAALSATIAALNGDQLPELITNPIKQVGTQEAASYNWQWTLAPGWESQIR